MQRCSVLVLASPVLIAGCELAFPTHEALESSSPDGGDGGVVAEAGADTPSPDAPDGVVDASASPPPSCEGLPKTCGANGDGDCCASLTVPATKYKRSYDGVTANDPSNPATVSELRLDAYEVTVARFRRFAAGFPANKPAPGDGKDPHNKTDTGWLPSYDASLPADGAALAQAIRSCDGDPKSTWTDAPGPGDALPLNCVRWFEAFAFCIWDGGRLPTEAEWNLAAAGGADQRVYPWSSPASSTAIDPSQAAYARGAPSPVGAKSAGNGRWGHSDLAGNVAEWVLDWKDGTYINPCTDCAALSPLSERVVRGGGYEDPASALYAALRGSHDPRGRSRAVGVRCARDR